MILLTNGCSWTWGGGIKWSDDIIRQQSVWPYHLGNLLNAKTVNLAIGCGSNQRIFRTTLDYILNNHNHKEETIAVIQITEPARYEYYVSPTVNDFKNLEERWTRITPSAHIGHIDEGGVEQVITKKNYRYKNYTDIEGMYNLISVCSSLSKIFTDNNIKYYFWTGPFKVNIYPYIYKKYLKDLGFIDLNDKDYTSSWEYQRTCPHGHPDCAGHKQIAHLIYNIISSTETFI